MKNVPQPREPSEDVQEEHRLRLDVAVEKPLVPRPYKRRPRPQTAIIARAAQEAQAAREWAEQQKGARTNERFWAKVQVGSPEACWPWLGYVTPRGRPLTQHRCTSIYASRKAWILTHGEIRDARCVNHICDNALCCNPAHLYLGTRVDNMIDRWGRIPAGERGPYGRKHAMTLEQVETIVKEHQSGVTITELAKKFRVHRRTIERRLKERAKLSNTTKR